MLHESYAARKIVKRGGYSYIVEYNEQVRKFNRERELIDKGISEVQNEIKQLENELEEIKSEQKGQKKNELNRRIADLLERRSRTVNQSGERVTNGERTVQADKQQTRATAQGTGTTDTDTLIRQAKAVNDSARAEIANTRLDSEQSKSERTNIADKSGKQTSEEKRRRNRR